MRLYYYLVEQSGETLNEALEILQNKCKPFLRDLKKNFRSAKDVEFLYSGRSTRRENYFVGTVRKNRRPKDTPPEVQDYIDG